MEQASTEGVSIPTTEDIADNTAVTSDLVFSFDPNPNEDFKSYDGTSRSLTLTPSEAEVA